MSQYLDNFYGLCDVEQCRCLHPGPWLGVGCRHWHPTGAKTWEELRGKMREYHDSQVAQR